MLKFKKVEAQNYKSFKNLTMKLADKGLVLIEGENNTNDSYDSNGSGKSTLLETITYAIYDIGALSIRADEVVNRKVGKDTFVKLYFEQNGVDYRIERYRKHSEFKNKVRLFQGEEEITGATNRDTNESIEGIIGITVETYMNSIMYGQGTEPLFSEATDKGKKEILENITNISIYAKASDIAKEKVKELELEIADIERNMESKKLEVATIEDSVAREVERYEEVKKMIEVRKEELENAKKERKAFPQSNLRKLKNDIKNLGQPLPEFMEDPSQVNRATEELNEISSKAQEFRQAIEKIKMTIGSKRAEQNSLDTAEVCPTCGSKLSNDHAKMRHQTLETEIQGLTASVETYNAQYVEAFQPLIDDAEAKLRDARVDMEANRQEYHDTKHKREMEEQQLRSQLETYERNKEQLIANLDRAKKALKEVENLPKPDEREEEIKELGDMINELLTQKNKAFIDQVQYEDVVTAFSNKGIRSVVLDLVTPTLTNSANKYLNVLSESTLSLEFTTQVENSSGELSDKFDVLVNHSGEETTFQTLSQGEKTRVNVAISLALQDLVYSNSDLKTNIALYDEVFDGLDDRGISSVISILKDKAEEIGTVFVITHSNTMKPLFENVLTVEKTEDTSKILEDR